MPKLAMTLGYSTAKPENCEMVIFGPHQIQFYLSKNRGVMIHRVLSVSTWQYDSPYIDQKLWYSDERTPE